MSELGRQKPHIYKENGMWVGMAKYPLVIYKAHYFSGNDSLAAAYSAIAKEIKMNEIMRMGK